MILHIHDDKRGAAGVETVKHVLAPASLANPLPYFFREAYFMHHSSRQSFATITG